MNLSSHTSAKPSHYDKDALNYDQFNEKNSRVINRLVERILRKNKVKTVLDVTCGTGSQIFYLANRGYEVVGSDINSNMLRISKVKARQEKLNIKLLKGDMRTVKVGKFDAVISIFNAVGHLTKLDFEKAMRNIRENLNDDGLFVFDIFNLNYLLKDNNITKLTIDWQKVSNNTKLREIQYSTIDEAGVLASYTTLYSQKNAHKPKITKSIQTLQVYTAKQLKEILLRNGFKVLDKYSPDGSKFFETKSERIVIVAKKF